MIFVFSVPLGAVSGLSPFFGGVLTKFLRIFMVVLSLVGLLSINVGAAVIAESGSTFDQDSFTYNSNLSNFSGVSFLPVEFPGGFRGLGTLGPLPEASVATVVFDLPVRFDGLVSSFSVSSSALSRAYFHETDGEWVFVSQSNSVTSSVQILSSNGDVLGSSSVSLSSPTDSFILRVTLSQSAVASPVDPRGIGFKFSYVFSDVVFSDVSFLDYLMSVPSVVLGVVGLVTSVIVDQPFLLMTSGILLLGAGCGILGRVLSRD